MLLPHQCGNVCSVGLVLSTTAAMSPIVHSTLLVTRQSYLTQALTIIPLSFSRCSLTLGGRVCDTDVTIMSEHSSNTYDVTGCQIKSTAAGSVSQGGCKDLQNNMEY